MPLHNFRVFPLLCALLVAAAGAAQDETPEEAFQRDVIKAGIMHLPGVEAVAFDLDEDDSYLVVYVNQNALRTFTAAMRDALAPLVSQYKIKRFLAERPVLEFHALQAGPAQMGTSTSNDEGCGAGTLGIVAIDDNNVQGYITNAHVAAARGRRQCVNGTEKDQVAPARRDFHDCRSTTKIGELVAATRIPVDGVTPGNVDGAFVAEVAGQIDPKNACNLCTASLSIVKPDTTKGMEVRTCGRGNATATTGTVRDETALAWVRYPCGLRALFQSQILVEGATFARPGYSGAVAYGFKSGSLDGVVGLVFASDLRAGLTLMNPMQTVLDELTVLNNAVKITIDEDRHCK